MITREEFANLRQGDVILWGRPDRAWFRTVAEGPSNKHSPEELDNIIANNRNPGGIILPIYRRSWTGRINTVYNFNDCRRIVTPTGVRRKGLGALMSPAELERLVALGFKVSKQLRREIAEFESARKRGCDHQNSIMQNAPRFCRPMVKALEALRFAGL